MYTVQALWTMAREKLPCVVVLLANRSYGIFSTELQRCSPSPPFLQSPGLSPANG